VQNPTSAAGLPGPRLAVNATFKTVAAYIIGDGAVLAFVIENRPDFKSAGSLLLATAYSASASAGGTAIAGSAGTSTLTAGNWLWLSVVGISGTVSTLAVTIHTTEP